MTKDQARFRGDGSVEVGSFPANRFGLHDMHGNVWEWCEDNWHANYEGAPTDGSAWQGGDAQRVLRGGFWAHFLPDYLRSANRDRLLPYLRLNGIGFRVARTLLEHSRNQ
jgi:formylglycine-generating enzyme required for sulfatase activity